MNKIISTIKSNPAGAIVGAAAGFYIAKKYVKVEKPSLLILATVVGVSAGIFIQANVMKKSSAVVAKK